MADNGKFEREMDEWNHFSSEQKEKKVAEIKNTCKDHCGVCPTHENTGEGELAFCVTGRSCIIQSQNGCLCPSCPVHEQRGYRWMYFCIRGPAMDQQAEEEMMDEETSIKRAAELIGGGKDK